MAARVRRLQREIALIRADTESKITIELVQESLTHLIGTFKGPPDTPYEGGTYKIDIRIPDAYPFKPLEMKFLTKLYHPNVSSASGTICSNVLEPWNPILTIGLSILRLQCLMAFPEMSDAQDKEVARHYRTSREGFEEIARYWAEIYAAAPPAPKVGGRCRKWLGWHDGRSGEDEGCGNNETPIIEKVLSADYIAPIAQQHERSEPERKKVIDVLKRLYDQGEI